MSPKELLYIQDALDHAAQTKQCCSDFSAQIQDPSLKTLLQNLSTKQNETFTKFYSLLNH